MGIPQRDTDLRRRYPLLRKSDNDLVDLQSKQASAVLPTAWSYSEKSKILSGKLC